MVRASDLIAGSGLATKLINIAEESISSGSISTANVNAWLVDPASNPNGLEIIRLLSGEASGSSGRYLSISIGQTLGTPINTIRTHTGEPPIDLSGLWLPSGYGVYCYTNLSSSGAGKYSFLGVFR